MASSYRIKQVITLIGDFGMFTAGLFFALTLRYTQIPDISQFLVLFNYFVYIFIAWLAINYVNGLYDIGKIKTTFEYQKRIAESIIISIVLGFVFFYFVQTNQSGVTPKTLLVLTSLFGYELMFIWRLITRKLLVGKVLNTNVLFVGNNQEVKELIEIMQKNPIRGYRATAIIDTDKKLKSHHIKNNIDKNIEVYDSLQKIRPAISLHNIELVVIAPHLKQDKNAIRELYELLFWKVQIADLATFYELLTGRIPPLTFSEGWFLDHLKNKKHRIYDHLTRLFDLTAGLIIGTTFILLFPILGLAIKLSSKGPVFYSQIRVGKDEKEFKLYKLRSMYALSKDGGAEKNGAVFASKNDKRITKVGKFLRKSRLDEFPQALNLIKGDLALIGPRPERPEIINKIQHDMPYYTLRHTVKPGITGWAVVNQNYTDTLEQILQKLQYDLYYIKNRSLLLDMSILLKTVNVVGRMMGR